MRFATVSGRPARRKNPPMGFRVLVTHRGSVMVVTLLVLLGLASIGIVAVNKIANEQSIAANARRGALAYHVTEAGAYTSLAFTDYVGAAGLSTILAQVGQMTNLGDEPTMTPEQLVGFPFFDMSKSGSFGYEGWSQEEARETTGIQTPPMDFRVRITSTGMIQPIEGYSLNGRGARCRFRHQFDSDGNLGLSPTSDEYERFRAWKRIRALVNVGPLPCRQSGGNI